MIQAWLRGRQQEVGPRYVGQVLTSLSAILRAAVEHGRIATNPCDAASVKPPKVRKRRIVPWSVERIQAITDTHAERDRGPLLLAAGCGLRQGEAFGVRGEPVTGTLVFTEPDGGAIVRHNYNRQHWKPVLEAVGVTPSRRTGMHQLRHHYASVLLDGGVSIRALAEYLGHSDPASRSARTRT